MLKLEIKLTLNFVFNAKIYIIFENNKFYDYKI